MHKTKDGVVLREGQVVFYVSSKELGDPVASAVVQYPIENFIDSLKARGNLLFSNEDRAKLYKTICERKRKPITFYCRDKVPFVYNPSSEV